jgi:hypothetical protein
MKLSFNEANVLRLMEATFSSSNTFITELMQNARRAGATVINIMCGECDGGGVNMNFTDDGIGIDDFSKLMTVAESGWNEEVQKVDKPFGAGFLAAILSCESGYVESKGKKLSWVTKDLLEGGQALIEDVVKPVEGVTEIGLYGVATKKPNMLSQSSAGELVELQAYGFPISVIFNGRPVSRKHATGDLINLHIPEVGTLCFVKGITVSHRVDLAVYLQGLPIEMGGETPYGRKNWTQLVLHLDSEHFEARMPDRAALRDDSVEAITKKVKKHYAALAVKVFDALQGHFTCAGDYLFVANNAPDKAKLATAIPSHLFEVWDNPDAEDCVRSLGSWQDDWGCVLDREGGVAITEADFKRHTLLSSFPSNGVDNMGAVANAMTCLAEQNGTTFLTFNANYEKLADVLPSWVPKAYDMDFDSDNVLQVSAVGEPRAMRFQGVTVQAYHVPVDYFVRLLAKDGFVVGTGKVQAYDMLSRDGKLMIRNLENPGCELFRQDLEFVEGSDDDYNWDEDWEDEQIRLLAIELANTFDDDEDSRASKLRKMVEEEIRKAINPYCGALNAQGKMIATLEFVDGEVRVKLHE